MTITEEQELRNELAKARKERDAALGILKDTLEERGLSLNSLFALKCDTVYGNIRFVDFTIGGQRFDPIVGRTVRDYYRPSTWTATIQGSGPPPDISGVGELVLIRLKT